MVVVVSQAGNKIVDPITGDLPAARFGRNLAREPEYLDAIRGDWRRPVVIVKVGEAGEPVESEDLDGLVMGLLGTPDPDRAVYVSEHRVSLLGANSWCGRV